MLLFLIMQLLLLCVLLPCIDSALGQLDMSPSAIGLVNAEAPKLNFAEQTGGPNWTRRIGMDIISR